MIFMFTVFSLNSRHFREMTCSTLVGTIIDTCHCTAPTSLTYWCRFISKCFFKINFDWWILKIIYLLWCLLFIRKTLCWKFTGIHLLRVSCTSVSYCFYWLNSEPWFCRLWRLTSTLVELSQQHQQSEYKNLSSERTLLSSIMLPIHRHTYVQHWH